MALIAKVLVDTSAQARMADPVVSSVIAPKISSGLAATCAALDFEALFSRRSAADYEQVRGDRQLAYEYLATTERDWQRALEVQRRLAAASRTRAVGMPDLVIAAVAERERVAIMHYDSDFELIAEITGQEMRWVAPRGSL
ncbi:MAG TPA: PIN domain nuclease [Galbitalea sp.]|jgi:hypothetical protein|nr:PIN domain nuclease [Galbitalea sp.]